MKQWQRINFQNIQAAHTTQCQRTKKPNQKVGKRPEQTFLQRRHQFSSVQSLSRVWLFATPWTAACQASLSITNSRSPPKLMSIESMMPSNRLILCHPLLLLPSVFPSIRVFSNESAPHIRRPKYWSFSFNTSPSNEHSGRSPLGWTGWIFLQSKGFSRVFSNTTVQKHQFFGTQLSLQVAKKHMKSCSIMSDSLWPHRLQYQASLSITNSQSLLKFMSIEPVMLSNHISHPLPPPSPFAFSLSQHQPLFQ